MKKVLFIFTFIVGSLYLQWQLFHLDAKKMQVARENAALKKQNDEQQAKNEQLKTRLADLQENPDETFEELAREKLFMVLPDEIYVLPESETQ